jgi:hypothetical protein
LLAAVTADWTILLTVRLEDATTTFSVVALVLLDVFGSGVPGHGTGGNGGGTGPIPFGQRPEVMIAGSVMIDPPVTDSLTFTKKVT